MSAAIQLVNPQAIQTETADNQLSNLTSFEQPSNVSSFELAPENRLRRALAYIAQLQAEVKTLREELAYAERSVAHKEMLIRNATLREQELRAELVKDW